MQAILRKRVNACCISSCLFQGSVVVCVFEATRRRRSDMSPVLELCRCAEAVTESQVIRVSLVSDSFPSTSTLIFSESYLGSTLIE